MISATQTYIEMIRKRTINLRYSNQTDGKTSTSSRVKDWVQQTIKILKFKYYEILFH